VTQTPSRWPDGRMAKWILLLTLLLTLAARWAAGQDTATKGAGSSLFENAKRASVEVLVNDHLDGTGWFADSKGLLFTAGHVVGRPGQRIEVLSPVAGRLAAKVLAVDLGHDLALLSVAPRAGGYPVLPLAEKRPPPGEEIFLLGTPIFRHAILLRGMMAHDQPAFEYYSDHYIEIVHVAATAPGGVSGGPWLNRRGEVVGLQSGVMSLNNVPVGIADMSPLEAIRGLLACQRTAATPSLGAALEEPWQQDRGFLDRFPPQTEGLVVKLLQKDGPAARAGLKQWDLIVAIDGHKVRVSEELLRIVLGKRPGQEVELTMLGPDGTGQRKVKVLLGKLEAAWPEPAGK
jgi:serine protease Do